MEEKRPEFPRKLLLWVAPIIGGHFLAVVWHPGIAWFAGSAIMGLLYEESIAALIRFSVILQLLALPVLSVAHMQERERAAR